MPVGAQSKAMRGFGWLHGVRVEENCGGVASEAAAVTHLTGAMWAVLCGWQGSAKWIGTGWVITMSWTPQNKELLVVTADCWEDGGQQFWPTS